jgi:hypothetical protein
MGSRDTVGGTTEYGPVCKGVKNDGLGVGGRTMKKIIINNFRNLKGMKCRQQFLQTDIMIREDIVKDVHRVTMGWMITLRETTDEYLGIVITDTVGEDGSIRLVRRWDWGIQSYVNEGVVRIEDMESTEGFVRALEGVVWK